MDDGFYQLSLALVSEVLRDDRLVPGGKGEVSVFWAAVSWLEAQEPRRRDADEVCACVRLSWGVGRGERALGPLGGDKMKLQCCLLCCELGDAFFFPVGALMVLLN